jgi:putative transposase
MPRPQRIEYQNAFYHVMNRGRSRQFILHNEKIVKKVMGRIEEFEARKVAMYLCQQLSGDYLIDIAVYFNLSNTGSVSFATCNIKKKRSQDKKFNKTIEKIIDLIARKVT